MPSVLALAPPVLLKFPVPRTKTRAPDVMAVLPSNVVEPPLNVAVPLAVKAPETLLCCC
jgi:hypothetical protein